MTEELWGGIWLKISNAEFFLDRMKNSLQLPERTMSIPYRYAATNFGMSWQRSFYAYLDAFLAMCRSIPDITNCCFGADLSPPMKNRFNGLDTQEQNRRRTFSTKFRAERNAFGKLPLSSARNITLHRTGSPPVEVAISGRFGVTYPGSPVQHVPSTETRPIAPSDYPANPAVLWQSIQPPVPIEPKWTYFTIDSKALFPECQAYLQQAQILVEHARAIAQQVHGNDTLTSPKS
jgi:hypothetical protein